MPDFNHRLNQIQNDYVNSGNSDPEFFKLFNELNGQTANPKHPEPVHMHHNAPFLPPPGLPPGAYPPPAAPNFYPAPVAPSSYVLPPEPSPVL